MTYHNIHKTIVPLFSLPLYIFLYFLKVLLLTCHSLSHMRAVPGGPWPPGSSAGPTAHSSGHTGNISCLRYSRPCRADCCTCTTNLTRISGFTQAFYSGRDYKKVSLTNINSKVNTSTQYQRKDNLYRPFS